MDGLTDGGGLMDGTDGAAKGTPKHDPEAFQNPARHVPKPSKIEVLGTPGRQNTSKKRFRPAKSAQEVPKGRPRIVPEAPGAAQERPKAGQETPQSRPSEPRTPSESSPERGSRAFGARIIVEQGLGTNFQRF